jgi:hypothetical protein
MKWWYKTRIIDPAPQQRVVYHLLFWLLLFAVRSYLTGISFNVYSDLSNGYVTLLNLCSTALIAAAYYVIAGPVRQLITNKRMGLAISGIMLIIVFYTIADAIAEVLILKSCENCMHLLKDHQPAYYALLSLNLPTIIAKRLLGLGTPLFLLLALSIPLCIKLAREAWRAQVKSLQLAKDNVELEFNFLKSQINPHFLFNTMNNIYGLILKKDTTRSAEMVARLSTLFRYMLYDTDKTYAPLDKELKLLSDYIELEKIRLNDTAVEVEVGTDNPKYEIPPLLFILLAENAFKFTVDQPGARIFISLQVIKGRLELFVENTGSQPTLTEQHGIGISNLLKRLELYYKGRYSYAAAYRERTYFANLIIDL